MQRTAPTLLHLGFPLEEIWWTGDLFYRHGPAPMGRSRFEGVLVTGLDANPPYTPVRTVLRASATSGGRSRNVVDRLHSWLQLEGSLFSDSWAEGVTLHPGGVVRCFASLQIGSSSLSNLLVVLSGHCPKSED